MPSSEVSNERADSVFRNDPYPAYNFEVVVTGISDDGRRVKGSYKEGSRLNAEVEVVSLSDWRQANVGD
ncbi:MAG: hypothetical protein LAO56_07500 [Acidobacteriia bacterium]|nr:hypothetical protein [Terriglobia bacterium]